MSFTGSSRRCVVPFFTGLLACLAFVSTLRGGIYNPSEPCYFDEFDAEGLAKPIGYSNFRLILTEILRIDPREGMGESKNRADTLARVQKFKSRPVKELNSIEIAGYSSDLIRLGGSHLDEALNLLVPLSNQRGKPDFFVQIHLAKLYQDRQDFASAYRRASATSTDAEFPKAFPGHRPEQLSWLKRVEWKFNLPLLRARWQEEKQKRTGVQENVDSLFPIQVAGKEWQPVHYYGRNGEYQVGSLDPAEAAKLPPDAVAVAQQLILWNPHDPRLHWQLAELYNAKGDSRAALELMDECVNYPRNYSNRTLMEHRAAIRSHQERLIEDETRRVEGEKSTERRRYYLVGGVLGSIVLLLLVWQARQIGRRWRS